MEFKDGQVWEDSKGRYLIQASILGALYYTSTYGSVTSVEKFHEVHPEARLILDAKEGL